MTFYGRINHKKTQLPHYVLSPRVREAVCGVKAETQTLPPLGSTFESRRRCWCLQRFVHFPERIRPDNGSGQNDRRAGRDPSGNCLPLPRPFSSELCFDSAEKPKRINCCSSSDSWEEEKRKSKPRPKRFHCGINLFFFNSSSSLVK